MNALASYRRPLRWLLALAAWIVPALAQAGYFQWDVVTLPASSGASCGNGTPYRFFVNRTPFNRHLAIVYEGGGACWDQAACAGVGPLSAVNPNGIPSDYMQKFENQPKLGLVTPFSARIDPFQAAPTQSWNMVYLPYCTGDVHTGSALREYSDADPAHPRVQYHYGQANIRAAATWLRDNTGRPEKLLLTGFSAGSVGATANYGVMRETLQPTGRSQLLADSGLLFPAPRTGSPAVYPSLPLHETIRAAWKLDKPGGLLSTFASMAGYDPNNLGSITSAVAMRYPQDRFGFLMFQADGNFSAFSYAKFYPEFGTVPPGSPAFAALLNTKWRLDLENYLPSLASHANVGYHAAFFRPFNQSHCLTIIDWSGTGIEEDGIPSIAPFVDNILQRQAGPMRNYEDNNVADLTRPVSWVLTLLGFLGIAQ